MFICPICRQIVLTRHPSFQASRAVQRSIPPASELLKLGPPSVLLALIKVFKYCRTATKKTGVMRLSAHDSCLLCKGPTVSHWMHSRRVQCRKHSCLLKHFEHFWRHAIATCESLRQCQCADYLLMGRMLDGSGPYRSPQGRFGQDVSTFGRVTTNTRVRVDCRCNRAPCIANHNESSKHSVAILLPHRRASTNKEETHISLIARSVHLRHVPSKDRVIVRVPSIRSQQHLVVYHISHLDVTLF